MRLAGTRATLILLVGLGLAGCAVIHPHLPGADRVPTTSPVAAKALDWRAAQRDIASYPECLGRPIAACTLVHGTGRRVLLMGDSLARMWLPAFTAIARLESLTLAVAIHPACPWPKGLGGLGISPDCQTRRADWYKRVIPAFDPDIVFLANRPYDAPGNVLTMELSGRVVSARDPIAVHAITESTRRSLDLLRRRGRELVLLEPTPLPEAPAYDPMTCVSGGNAHCSFTVSPLAAPLTRLDRDLASTPNVWSMNLDRLVCPRFPVCDSVVHGVIVRRDHTHLTATYVRALAGPLDAALHRRGILRPVPAR